ncbi:MAG: PAS domain-containing protein [Thermoplasmatota archaeon]|jgi:PAS domain S-box-containing protein
MKKENLNLFDDFDSASKVDEYDYIDKILIGTDRNKILFDRSPIAIVFINEKGIFLDANKKLYDWLGYKPSEIIGKTIADLPFLPDKSKKIIVDNFFKRMRGEEIPVYEIEFIHKNGMRKFGEVYGSLLRDHVYGISMDIVMVSDVTEKKKALDNLKDNEKRYKILFENTSDLVQFMDAYGKFVEVNPAWLNTLEYSKEEVNNLKLVDIIRKDEIQHCLELFNKVCQGESIKDFETFFVSKTGKEIFVKGRAKSYFKDGVFVSTIGIFKCISENDKK